MRYDFDTDNGGIKQIYSDDLSLIPDGIRACMNAVCDADNDYFHPYIEELTPICDVSHDAWRATEVAWNSGAWDGRELDRAAFVAAIVTECGHVGSDGAAFIADWYPEMWPFALHCRDYGSHMLFDQMTREEYEKLLGFWAMDEEQAEDALTVLEDGAFDGVIVIGEL